MRSLLSLFNFKRDANLEKLSSLDKLNLSWFLTILFTVVLLSGVAWYAIAEFKYWSNVEQNVTITPPDLVKYDQAKATEVLNTYRDKAAALELIRGERVEILSETTSSAGGGAVRVGQ